MLGLGASQPPSQGGREQAGEQQERGRAAGPGEGSEERRETDGKTEEEDAVGRGWVDTAVPRPSQADA